MPKMVDSSLLWIYYSARDLTNIHCCIVLYRSSEGEVVATLTHTLKSGMSRLYTWDYPQNVQELFYQVVSSESKGGTLKLKVRRDIGSENKESCVAFNYTGQQWRIHYPIGVHWYNWNITCFCKKESSGWGG